MAPAGTSRARKTTHVVRAASCALLLVLAGAAAVQAQRVMFARDGSGSELAREAVALCLRAARASGDEREALLDRGLAVAERAVAASDRDAKAHFAVFCNLGRKLEDEGASLANVARLGRLRAAIDRALALEPAFVDALAAKGAMLVRLPAILGGDDDEGEHLIRRAVELAPDHPPARLELAKALAEKGEEDEALTEARTVIALAGGTEAVEASEARDLESRLGS